MKTTGSFSFLELARGAEQNLLATRVGVVELSNSKRPCFCNDCCDLRIDIFVWLGLVVCNDSFILIVI